MAEAFDTAVLLPPGEKVGRKSGSDEGAGWCRDVRGPFRLERPPHPSGSA